MNNNLFATDAILKTQLWVLLKNVHFSETKYFLINVYNNKLRSYLKMVSNSNLEKEYEK